MGWPCTLVLSFSNGIAQRCQPGGTRNSSRLPAAHSRRFAAWKKRGVRGHKGPLSSNFKPNFCFLKNNIILEIHRTLVKIIKHFWEIILGR